MKNRRKISSLIAQKAPDKADGWETLVATVQQNTRKSLIPLSGVAVSTLMQRLAAEEGHTIPSPVMTAVGKLPDAEDLLELPDEFRDYRAAVFGILGTEQLGICPRTKQVVIS